MKPSESGPAEQISLGDELAAARKRLELINRDGLDGDAEGLVADLETAYEELRVADEEVRVQHDQITTLLEGQHLLRWQQERMVAVLPVPVLMTDSVGIIRSVNASAASLVQMSVARLVGKPVLTLVAPDDRADVRRLLGKLGGDGASFRRVVGMHGRDGHVTSAELFVSRLPGPSPEVTWMLLVGAETERGAGSITAAMPQSLTELALLPTAVSDRQEALHRAAVICQESLGPDVHVSLSVGPPDAPEGLAATSRLAQEFDGAQIAAGEGPCVSAFEEMATVESRDVRSDDRWPRLARQAPDGVNGVVAAPLQVGDDLVGALNVYVSSDQWPVRLREDADLLASTVAAVLFELGLKKELEQLAADLELALQSRAVIDQAKGMVMAGRRVDAQAAFEHLVQLSSTQNTKLREIAQQMVDRASSGSDGPVAPTRS